MITPKDRRPEEEKQRQADYEEVLSLMKYLAPDTFDKDNWNSKTTNEIINKVLLEWGVNETLFSITNDNAIAAKAARLILINDLLDKFTVNEIIILLYYTFDMEGYNKLMAGIIPEAKEEKYYELSQRLNTFMMEVISKFNIDESILKILPDMSTYRFSSENQIRILWYNRLIGIEVICKYGNLYSEEFTDYVIDHIICKASNIDNENRKKDYLLNIYTLMNARYWLYHSDMFKEKHKEHFNTVTKIQVNRTYGLSNRLSIDDTEA